MGEAPGLLTVGEGTGAIKALTSTHFLQDLSA